MKITNSKEALQIYGRLYLPVTVEAVCPECREEVAEDFTKNYLLNPTANIPFEHHLICSKEHKFDVKLTLAVTLEEAKS